MDQVRKFKFYVQEIKKSVKHYRELSYSGFLNEQKY